MPIPEAAASRESKARASRPNVVIILKGPPGVGKSHTARKLVARLPGTKKAIIGVDDILHIDQRGLSADKAKLATFHAALVTRSFLREGFDVVIEYTFDLTAHLEFLIDKLQHSHVEHIPQARIHTFHLSASIEEVQKRNGSRRDGSDPLPEPSLRRLHATCEATAGAVQDEVVLDTTRMSVGKVVARIVELAG